MPYEIVDYYNDNRIWITVEVNALFPEGIGYQETQRYVIGTKFKGEKWIQDVMVVNMLIMGLALIHIETAP